MNIISKKIDITPDKTIFPKLGQTGYNIAEALSELIDNSIDARLKNVNIEIDIDSKRQIITLEDDGRGMDEKQARESIILGKSSKEQGELGQFGIGLKTACMSLGKKFTVETTSRGNNELYIITFDEDEFLKSKSWSDFEIKIKKGVDKNKTGTKIIIEKLRIKLHSRIIETLSKHLSQRFSPFLRNKEAKIELNSAVIKPEIEKVVEGTKKDFNIDLSNGSKINGWTGILEVGSVERSGFNLFRFNRLIRAHEKLGYLYHPSKMWITGDIYLDPIPVTHNKREFITEDPLYVEFFDKFQEILKPILAEAQKRHREEKIKDLPKELRETLKDSLLKALNKVDDFKELAFPESQEPVKRSPDGTPLDKEVRDSNGTSITETKDEPEGTKHRTPHKTSERKVRFITIAGKKYKFDYDWKPLDEDIAKESYLDKDNGTIMVILNSRYHMLNVMKPDWFYHAIYLTEGIVEVFLKENNQGSERILPLRDKLARRLADIISEDIDEKMAQKDSQTLTAHTYLLKAHANQDNDTKGLSDNQKKVLELRLEDGLNLNEIAKKLQLTRQRIDQLFKSALVKITESPEDKLSESDRLEVVDSLTGKEKATEILANIANSYGVEEKDLVGERRTGNLILPRHLIMYLMRKRLSMSFPEIAKIMKRSNHTTIMHAVNKIDKLIKEDKINIH